MKKRIWEVDCLSLDAVMAASFDWRELAERLRAAGQSLDAGLAPEKMEYRVHVLMHQFSHTENSLSLWLEEMLDRWYGDTAAAVQRLESGEAAELALTFDCRNGERLPGILWALATDPRPGFDCLRRRLHQRIQITAVRQWARGIWDVLPADAG